MAAGTHDPVGRQDSRLMPPCRRSYLRCTFGGTEAVPQDRTPVQGCFDMYLDDTRGLLVRKLALRARAGGNARQIGPLCRERVNLRAGPGHWQMPVPIAP
jgi:hypothetical protein